MEISVDGPRFHERLRRLRDDWLENSCGRWDNCGAICIPMGSATETDVYSKASAVHLYLMGYEFPDSIILITKSAFYFMAAQKKCNYLQNLATTAASGDLKVTLFTKSKDEVANREHFRSLLQTFSSTGKKLGTLTKASYLGDFIHSWMSYLESNTIDTAEIGGALGLFLSVKLESELELCKRAAVLSNKVLKNVFVAEMEDVIDKDLKVSHANISSKVENVIFDPSSIGIKLAADVVESCFQPIIQSGGKYNIKASAQSNDENMRFDVIICSLGARYKSYCANISRTFMVDPVPRISEAYAVLSDVYDKCLEQMLSGSDIRSVVENAKTFLSKRDASLVPYLSKSLGFATGLEFRDSTMLISSANTSTFAPGMIFVLSVGFQDIPLEDADKLTASDNLRHLRSFSLLISDTVCIQSDGSVPEVLTKASRSFEDVSYNMEKANDDEESTDKVKDLEADVETRRSLRTSEDRKLAEEALQKRMLRQQELMERKISEARRRIESGSAGHDEVDPAVLASELKAYRDTESFPKDLVQNRLKVDVSKEAVIVPIDGQPVPFHISTIKNVSMPEPDRATYLRINFYAPGLAISKDTPKNMQHLLAKHGHTASFIKELTFRSIDPRNLTQVYRMILELRKRARQKEQREDEEKDLVAQAKLIRIKDQRVPRLQDLTMRPQISGRKCVGTLEAHQNGLRFTSTKGEVVDVMYNNIKHAIYQPCEKSVMVLIHFHLKDFIMIGKKKQKDIQFYTEVIDSSLNLEGTRRSAYDPDEIDDEQREREMKKRLNAAFKEFCRKVERVAKHYEFDVEFDIPYIELAFYGNPHKEMVMIQPSVKCLVNLTENPFFVVDLSEVEHVHFERVNMATKNFDMSIIFKNFDVLPVTISAIDIQFFDMIQDWLNDVEITFTSGVQSINWKVVMEAVKGDDRFYFETDEDGEQKPAGWNFLRADASDDEEDEEDGDSSFTNASSEESEESSSDDDDSDFDEDDSEDDDKDEEEEEEGQSWEELEREAVAADKAKRRNEEQQDESYGRPKKQPRRK